jgi:hypothetical protein
MKAAMTQKPELERRFSPAGRYPLVQLRKRAEWARREHALERICGPSSATVCEGVMNDENLRIGLAGSIVVVGSFTAADRQIGIDDEEIPGVLLHADYIESVLSNTVYSPLPEWFGLVISLILFWVVEHFHQRYSPWHAGALSVILIVICFVISIYVFLWILRVYVNLWLPNGILIVFLYWLHPLWKRYSPIHNHEGDSK